MEEEYENDFVIKYGSLYNCLFKFHQICFIQILLRIF
jgi:hypothetical protein